MKRLILLVALAAVACSAPKPKPETQAPPPKPTAAERWKPVVDAPDRTADDKKLDPGRKPAETLEFVDLKPGMKVADIGAGGGYTSELLARAVGPQGVVYAQNPPQFEGFAKKPLDARTKRIQNIQPVWRPFDDPFPPEVKNLDAIVMNAIYHDAAYMPVDRARMLGEFFNALQPGGTFTLIDSSAKPGSGLSDVQTLHRIDEETVKQEVLKAGFKLVAEGQFLRNPQDTRDWSASPSQAGERRGTGDRFALKFVRPEGSKAQIIPPKLRLPQGPAPKHVTATLTIDPTKDTFTGVEEIAVTGATQLLWLNADDLKITNVQPQAQVIDGGKNFVGLEFAQPLAGEATIRIEWQGKLSSTDTDGAFRQQENGEWYQITHLEPLGARRIFPSFDEPSFKIPWKISLRVPKQDAAYFNTPIESSKDDGDMKVVTFAETKPLPDYLLAFGVGPYERVDAGKVQSGAPVGIVVTKGKTSWAKYSAKSSPKLMDLLEDYFGVPYHYPKLDLIEIPLGTGAMENPGLITFNQRINLAKPGQDTPQHQRGAASVEAHEFAHLWFGDLVTTAWWDDIWLNEAFATWMSSKISEKYDPAWDEPAARVASANGAMNTDRLLSARRIRQPIWSEGDIKNAFDGITYQKGAAVIGMFEAYVGPDKFQKGVHRYLTEHADGNATAKDFLAAISADAGQDIAPAFSTFLDQAGIPLVTGKVTCDGQKAHVDLEQKRYLPLGIDPARVPPQTWQIPICVRTNAARTCTLLAEKTGTLQLDHCPQWVMLNENATGYYRSQLDDAAQQALAKSVQQLSERERMQLMYDVNAAARAGAADFSRAAELATQLSQAKERPVVQSTVEVPAFWHDKVPDEVRAKYAAWVRQMYGKRAKQLGWKARAKESYDDSAMRPGMLAMVGDEGEDAATRTEAKKIALAWLKDRKSTTPDIAQVALHLAAIGGDAALWDRLHEAAKTEKDRTDRQRLLGALAAFRDPALVQKSLDLVLSGEFDPRESLTLLYGASGWPATRPLALDYVKKNFDALLPKLPRDSGASFVFLAVGACDEQHRKEAEEFFGPKAKQFTGGERTFAQAMESMRQCTAFREKAQPQLVQFLQSR